MLRYLAVDDEEAHLKTQYIVTLTIKSMVNLNSRKIIETPHGFTTLKA